MSRLAFFAFCFATFAALCAVNVLLNGPRLERELEARTFYAAKDEFSVEEVRFDGRDGVVVAMVRDAKERGELEKLANGVWGVRSTRVEVHVDRAPKLVVERRNDAFVASGTVPGGTRDLVWGTLATALGSSPAGELTEDPKLPHRPYIDHLYPYFSLLARGGAEARLELGKDTLHLRLAVESDAAREEVAARARQALPKKLQLVLELRNTARATANSPLGFADDAFRRTLEKLNPLFAFDQWRILPQSERDVREAAALLKAHPDRKVRVLGYTDALGSDAYNLRLSARRAEAIVAALLAEGVSPAQLVPEPRGKSDFVASNRTQAGRQANRRVQFVVIEQPTGGGG
jgi:outer membrane protein OmpA-like peptidoglycan-associated protein